MYSRTAAFLPKVSSSRFSYSTRYMEHTEVKQLEKQRLEQLSSMLRAQRYRPRSFDRANASVSYMRRSKARHRVSYADTFQARQLFWAAAVMMAAVRRDPELFSRLSVSETSILNSAVVLARSVVSKVSKLRAAPKAASMPRTSLSSLEDALAKEKKLQLEKLKRKAKTL